MKKNHILKVLFAFTLSIGLMLCVVSCGDNSGDEKNTTEQTTTEQTEVTTAPNEDAGFSKNY